MLKYLFDNKNKIAKIISQSKIEEWRGTRILYKAPRVDRIWMKIDNIHNLCLHKIYECNFPYYHRFNYEAACIILDGSLKMKFGSRVEIFGEVILETGSSYEMLKPMWRDVNPVKRPAFSIIILGKKFDDTKETKSIHTEKQILSEKEKSNLREQFYEFMSRPFPWKNL